MATIINSIPWTSQPQQAVGIDCPNSRIATYNAVSGLFDADGYSLTRSSSSSFGVSKSGVALNSTAINTSIYRQIVGVPSVAAPYLLLWSGEFIGNPTGSTAKIAGISTTGSSQSADLIGIERGATSNDHIQLTGRISTTSFTREVNVSATSWYGKQVNLALLMDLPNSRFRLFSKVDNVISVNDVSFSGSTAPSILGTERFVIGADIVESPTRFSNVKTSLVHIECGAIGDSRCLSLVQNPWQIFKPLPRRIFAPATTAGGLYTLTAQSGSYTISGQQATLLRHKNLTASAGTYNITGQSVNITYSPTAAVYTLTAQSGSYALTGRSATLLKSKVLSASSGSYSVTGNSATVSKNRVLTVSAGSYTITGRSATLTYIPLTPVYTLTAQTGVYNITGQTAQLLRHRLLSASSGTYTYTGQSISINKYTAGSNNLVKYFDVLAGDLLVLKPLGGTGGGTITATWGDITGILSAQTDLQNALDAKADSSSIPLQFNPIAGTNVTLSGTYPNITFNATGGGGTATQKQVTLDFGSVPSYSKAIIFTDAEITPTSKVVMTAHAESDELEMDGFVCSVQCGSGTATAYIHAVPGPVTGQRKFNYLIG